MPGPPGSAPHLAPCLRRARIVEVPTVNGIADRVALGAAGYLAALVGEFVCILHEDGDDWVYARTTRSSGWIKTSALAVGEEEEKETMEQAASDLESMYAADWDRVALSQLPLQALLEDRVRRIEESCRSSLSGLRPMTRVSHKSCSSEAVGNRPRLRTKNSFKPSSGTSFRCRVCSKTHGGSTTR